MFEANPTAQPVDVDVATSPDDSVDVRSVLRRSNLPAAVRAATPDFTQERFIDNAEIRRLTTVPSGSEQDKGMLARLATRRKVLLRYQGRSLLCAMIRLAGVCYTIEIDPITGSIAHWEWQ
jgi:hypothetical protein